MAALPNLKVGIFWDIEDYPPPTGISNFEIARIFRTVGQNFGTVCAFKAYLDLSLSTAASSSTLRSNLQSSGVSLIDCPRRSRKSKDVADKMLLADMMAFAMENPAPAVIVLIAGDRDYAYSVSLLRNHRYSIVILPPPSGADELLQQASFVFHPNDLFGRQMVSTLGRASEASARPIPDQVKAEQVVRPTAARPVKVTSRSIPRSTSDRPNDLDVPHPFVSLESTQPAKRASSRSSKSSSSEAKVYPPENPSIQPHHRQAEGSQKTRISREPAPPTPLPHPSLPSSSKTKTSKAPPLPVASSSSSTSDPRILVYPFAELVDILEQSEDVGVESMSRRTVKGMLMDRNPDILAGRSFRTYLKMAEKAKIVQCGAGQRWISLHWGYEDCLRVLYTPPHPPEPLPTPNVVTRPAQHSPLRQHQIPAPSALGLENVSLSPLKPKRSPLVTSTSPPRPSPVRPVFNPPNAPTIPEVAIREMAPAPNTSPRRPLSPSRSYPSPPNSNPAFSPQEPIPEIARISATRPSIETDGLINAIHATPDQSFTHIGSPAQLSSTAVSLTTSHKDPGYTSKKERDLGVYEDLLAVLKLRRDRPVLDSRKLSNVMKSRRNPPAWKLAGMSVHEYLAQAAEQGLISLGPQLENLHWSSVRLA